MVALPRCDELCQAVGSFDWEPVFILYYHWSMAEDERLARQIKALCDGLTDVIDERENFMDELTHWQILGREFELRAREKDRFIEKLKGNMDY
ncbi:hypothetical protein Tco_0879816 [Tanacetum coccineum]